MKPLLVYKLERVLDDFMETVTENGDESAPSSADFQVTKERLLGLLNGFYRAPFTVQRLLELLLEPNKHYKKFDKYSRGLEKVSLSVALIRLCLCNCSSCNQTVTITKSSKFYKARGDKIVYQC